MPTSVCLITAAVQADLQQRSKVGLNKYGVTVGDAALTTEQWLQHAYEEALDQAVYLKRVLTDMRANKQGSLK